MTELNTDTAEFRQVVTLLRAMEPELVMALFAASFWSDERVRQEIADDDSRTAPMRKN